MQVRCTRPSQILFIGYLLSLAVATSCRERRRAVIDRDPKTVEDKVFYALGMEFGRRIVSLSVSPAELAMLEAGLSDAVTRRTSKVDLEQIRPASSRLTEQRQKASAEEEKKKGLAFVERAAREPGAHRLAAGVVIKELRAGTGPQPGATDIVKVNYEGRLLDGTVFESSYKGKKPMEVGLLVVMSCWQIALPHMKVGAKARLLCPSEVAYGDDGMPPVIAGGATLVFDIELLRTRPLEAAPEVSAPRPVPPS
jgi:FKBP-type peptidyl-prolyl cis-trans isomerase FkpA